MINLNAYETEITDIKKELKKLSQRVFKLDTAIRVSENLAIKNCDLGGYYGKRKRNTTDRRSKDGRTRRSTGKKDR